MKQLSVNLIYSFDGIAQIFNTIPLPEIMLKNKEAFFACITTPLSEKEKAMLAKISCCIYGKCTLPKNHFYNKSNGKFWDIEIIHYMAKVWGVKSIITPVNTPDQFPELFTKTVPD